VTFLVLTAALLAYRARSPRPTTDPYRLSDPASRMTA